VRPLRPRTLAPSGFTPALEALLVDLPEALCATFIDDEGEAIDLATRVDPFDARVAGAAFAVPLDSLRAMLRGSALGVLGELRVEGGARSVLVRHVATGCDLVLVLAAPAIDHVASMRCAVTARELCAEAGLDPPAHHRALRAVELRRRADGLAAPRAFVEGDVRRRVSAVLGVAHHGAQTVWLVRASPDEEVLLAHDHRTDRWDRFDTVVDRGAEAGVRERP
jgi:hypothetical protein